MEQHDKLNSSSLENFIVKCYHLMKHFWKQVFEGQLSEIGSGQ